MSNDKQQIRFLSNWLFTAFCAGGVIILIIGLLLISISLPWWAVTIICCVGLSLIVLGVVQSVTMKCTVDANGITAPVSHAQKAFLSWDAIESVQIEWKYNNRYYDVYLLEFKSGDITMKIKTYENIVYTIKEFGKDNGNFYDMYSAALEKAETGM